ncbi:LITAF domain-containing protein [Caenorhabditis elegans]|uniref:LITAF domain-containing protein n=1 Tax=Caenorhabditis elegans TaxID=6239 RepID=C3JXF1_CAEEL|nr:LITAF domain-containing protein [Caenorhabditis elegans]CAY39360.1 LITAF domain-containing protein [Caenorhabditis elegans]|eukprot:NP_001256887.1 Uncharacterized protein CELE_Y116F11B.17 [Caenorhabditis elegans]
MSNPVPKINEEVFIDGTPLSPACPLCTHKMRGTPLPTDAIVKFGTPLPTDAANFGPDGTPLPTDETF